MQVTPFYQILVYNLHQFLTNAFKKSISSVFAIALWCLIVASPSFTAYFCTLLEIIAGVEQLLLSQFEDEKCFVWQQRKYSSHGSLSFYSGTCIFRQFSTKKRVTFKLKLFSFGLHKFPKNYSFSNVFSSWKYVEWYQIHLLKCDIQGRPAVPRCQGQVLIMLPPNIKTQSFFPLTFGMFFIFKFFLNCHECRLQSDTSI